MTESTTEERVVDVISEEVCTKKEYITRECLLVDDLGADSVNLVDICINIEDEFEIDIPDEDAEQITTVGQLVSYVTDALAERT